MPRQNQPFELIAKETFRNTERMCPVKGEEKEETNAQRKTLGSEQRRAEQTSRP
jgi:hypothetical protein